MCAYSTLGQMKYVYILQSIIANPSKEYVGLTDDLKARFALHNEGKSPHTAKYRPWSLKTYVAFSDEEKAVAFEKYLKVGSGQAFRKRHF
jgi:putative endonuclease